MSNQFDSDQVLSTEELLRRATEQDVNNSLNASMQVLNGEAQLIMQAVRQYDVAPHDLTGDRIQRARQLPKKMREDIAKVQSMVRTIITETAKNIENRSYRKWEDKINEKFVSRRERERASKLMVVDKQISISYRSLALAVQQFTDLNKMIITQLEEAEAKKDAPTARQLVLANAVLVYELCDFIIDFIEDFQIGGVNELKVLKEESDTVMAEFRRRQEALRKQAMGRGVSIENRNITLKHIEHHAEALKIIEEEWKTYLGQVDGINKSRESFIAKLPDLRLMRSNAEARLDFITLLQLHSFIRTNLQALNLAAETITSQLEMPRMTPERIKLLLGNLDE